MWKFCAVFTACLIASMAIASSGLPATTSETTKECLECHADQNPGLYQQWGGSRHFGANVGCYECHAANKEDIDWLRDGIHDDYVIATIVSPKDCGQCHSIEVDEFENSHHSKAGRIMGSLDNMLAEVVEGNSGMITPMFPAGISAAAVNGCWQCHGSEIKVDPETGILDAATWPNTGIGRVNPDGSEGSCAACHSRHDFSSALARRPENCGKCHLGPDHPQYEIYQESKHGIAYNAHQDDMALDSPKWIVGEDYTAAPTCATCHMSATKTQPISHNIGLRIKWNNRPPHSKLSHETDKKWNLSSAVITADERRESMIDVCMACHQQRFVDNFFVQYEGLLDLYETKYAVPGEKLYKAVQAVLKTDPTYVKFGQPVDFTWFEIWHHEGRRARHAASMMAPDYTHWHGTYDLAKNWITKYIPEIKEIIHTYGENDNAKEQVANLKKVLAEVQNSDQWRWSINAEDDAVKDARKKRQAEFKERY
jgi:hydroxylamine dehydrogenase